jgi:hypothetical protein
LKDWSLKINTHSRADIMKICALLAKAIGKDIIAGKRLGISITGSVECGKSAISDGITAAFSDAHNVYELAPAPLIEKYSGEARKRKSNIELPVDGNTLAFTLLHYISEGDIVLGHRDDQARIKPSKGGIDFLTVCGHQPRQKGDISIVFGHNMRCSYGSWARKLEIVIRDPDLQTPEMKEFFDHLSNFNTRREARVTEMGCNNVSFW